MDERKTAENYDKRGINDRRIEIDERKTAGNYDEGENRIQEIGIEKSGMENRRGRKNSMGEMDRGKWMEGITAKRDIRNRDRQIAIVNRRE